MTTSDEPATGAGHTVALPAVFRLSRARPAVVSRPALWQRLAQAGPRVTVVSGRPGSGKTMLLRSWVTDAGLAKQVAWVTVGRDERDPQRFWLSVLGALRDTTPGERRWFGELAAAPDLDGWTVAERLLGDLAPLTERLWLVLDDLHELGSAEARHQLELLVLRAPEELRIVAATRHDARLGLHRLRLAGELAQIRASDLRFSPAEARELLAGAGGHPAGRSGPRTELVERTEGWAAGLRLAALSLVGHPDPERLAAGFSGRERTVAEYLLAEVLRAAERTSAAAAPAHQCPRPGQRRAGQPADRRRGRRGGAAGPGGGERVGRGRPLTRPGPVPLPPAVRRPAPAGAAPYRAGRGRPRCTPLPPRWLAARGSSASRPSARPRRRGTGRWPPGCWPTTGPACT